MTVELTIHVQPVDGDPPVSWWADTAQVPGFYAAADTLEELRAVALDSLRTELGGDIAVIERLGDSHATGLRLVTSVVAA